MYSAYESSYKEAKFVSNNSLQSYNDIQIQKTNDIKLAILIPSWYQIIYISDIEGHILIIKYNIGQYCFNKNAKSNKANKPKLFSWQIFSFEQINQ